ncbi:hypothetical protein [Patiriisocius marinus]|uniref:hypothetical protein n=1 Tax=Patiriisocius marinus TaxID=1397112 RepID=UPI002330690D|nr:hypothetical protein [Patiriisocius marinus]
MILYLIPLVFLLLFNNKLELSYIIVFLFFIVVNSFEVIKNKFQNFYNKLNTTLDNFLIKENALDRIHEIYDILIPIFNDTNYFSKPIIDILCFQILDVDFKIINGSSFYYEIEFESKSLILRNKESFFKNVNLKLNNKDASENVILRVKQDTFDYAFVFILDKESELIITNKTFFYQLLLPFFSRLSHIFNFKRIQSIDDIKNFNNIAKKVTYVNNAISSMHFTRNKLSPFTIYLDMMDDYNSDISRSEKERIEPYLKSERKKLRNSLNEILDRANIILEKSNNPFNVLNSMEQPFINVLVKIRESSIYYLKNSNFEFSFENFNNDSLKNVQVNDTGIDLVLSNWFSNVNKYKADDTYGVTVYENSTHYTVIFHNSYVSKNYDKIPGFVKDFNSDDRMAILKRNTHGLIEIKDFLNQMDLKNSMYVKDSLIFFEINFLKYI